MRRQLALIFWWLALLLIIGGGAAGAAGIAPLPFRFWLGAGILTLALNVAVAGDLVVAPKEKPFSARGQVSRAVLDISAGFSDVNVQASLDYQRLASIRVDPGTKPDFDVVDGVAHLSLVHKRPWLPTPSVWRAELATNVLWDVMLNGALGHMQVDLRGIRADRVRVTNRIGNARVICPRRGAIQLEVETLLGNVEISVPPDAGARVKIERGTFARVELDTERFVPVDDQTYATKNIDTAQAISHITLRTRAGDVRLS